MAGLDYFRRAVELTERHLRPGQRGLHDAYRVNNGGSGTIEQVMREIEHLRRERRVKRAHLDQRRQRRARTRGLPVSA